MKSSTVYVFIVQAFTYTELMQASALPPFVEGTCNVV
jgi:hypothetical protein